MPDREKVIKGLECCLVSYEELLYQCDDCPYRATEDERKVIDWRCHLEELRKDALELLKEQDGCGWVSVKDRMPDKPCGCLVFNVYGWRALDFWEGNGWAISDENEITHWMPLPPGPEVKDE